MRARITAFSCGVIVLYCLDFIPPLLGVAASFVGLLFVARITPLSTLRNTCLIAAAFAAGLWWATWSATERLEHALPAGLEGRELQVRGYLCDIPSPGVYGSVRFSLCVEQWPAGQSPVDPDGLPTKLRLAWYGDQATLELPHRMQLAVRLKQPHGSLNPVGFRYETWLFRHNYRATGTVRRVDSFPELECSLNCQYHRLRIELANRLHTLLVDSEHHALAEALLIGHRGWMSDRHWQVFQDTGTIHLVAISGLHLGLVALLFGVVVRWVSGWLPRHWLSPSQLRLLTVVTVLMASSAFALLAGFTVPTRRALLMVAVAGCLLVQARQVSIWTGWLLALCLVLVFDPFAPMDQGFWLSFAAVALLILAFARRLRPASRPGTLVIAQLAVFIGLWPVLALAGQSTTGGSFVANLLAIPWLSLVVMPILLIGGCILAIAPGFSAEVGEVFDLVLGVLWSWLVEVSALPVFTLSGSFALAALVALAVMVCLLLPAWRVRVLMAGLVLSWIGLAGAPDARTAAKNTPVDQPEIWVWDVGQGLSVLLRDGDSVLLYDTGPESPTGYSAVTSVLLPNMRALGVRRVNQLVISHGDSDHAGGLAELWAALPVGAVVSGEPERLLSRWRAQDSLPVSPCEAGRGLRTGRLRVELWQYRSPGGGIPDSNDASCVLTAHYGDTEIILPGDIGREAEAAYLADLDSGNPVRRIVLAPHHGSKTSSSVEWVQALAPEVVIFSAGYQHRFGHPHDSVVSRYEAVGSRTYNTAHSGALHLVLGDNSIEVNQIRTNAPFWIRSTDSPGVSHGR
ncbi:MAG: DNA internalization-related competence protein ComEC/Rec2 [Marinobacter sp.]|nr:DNA internalization-related competence protein ComEC/Rec2 [Marinobacter sp.]